MKEEGSPLRTAERMRKQGKITRKVLKANPQRKVKPRKGVKGQSIISKIPTCDSSKVVYPEYMHLLLGLMKGVLVKLWFKTKATDKWSLKAHEDDINSMLKSIKVPGHMRAARSISYYLKWKASECRSFVLFSWIYDVTPNSFVQKLLVRKPKLLSLLSKRSTPNTSTSNVHVVQNLVVRKPNL